MKHVLILFLLCIVMTLGISGQSKKFDRKLKKSVKYQKELIFICNLPEKDFSSGKYKIAKKNTRSKLEKQYLVFKDEKIVAKIEIYSYSIVKIIPTTTE